MKALEVGSWRERWRSSARLPTSPRSPPNPWRSARQPSPAQQQPTKNKQHTTSSFRQRERTILARAHNSSQVFDTRNPSRNPINSTTTQIEQTKYIAPGTTSALRVRRQTQLHRTTTSRTKKSRNNNIQPQQWSFIQNLNMGAYQHHLLVSVHTPH